ncbi:hypothetical protein CPB83DRAFT_779065 [Crepidotus variabilis]|uniref:BRCT domain-containing protein n=1 Tax=Crepidotus variabilis TaxID=179855 RepID=A0A9P6ETZ6_9AGAR|nr:hypothetical protein CPB83DRAFT_779065 [Crepidotus variabilis]
MMNVDASVASDPNDSQATQLLQELLEPQTTSSRNQSEPLGSGLKTNSGHMHDISSDSLPSSTRHANSHPQYHFHGLAASQSQQQNPVEEELPNEGSQKENIGASVANKANGCVVPAAVSRASSPLATPSKNAQSKGSVMETRASTKGPVNKRATSVTSTFQSPKRKPSPSSSATINKPITVMSTHKPSTSRHNPTRRPPSSPTGSTDSFGEPYKQDELSLARADKFNIPLSALGADSSPAREGSNATNATGGTSHISASSYHGSRMPVNLSPPTGRVLVEATPSNSTQSQEYNQQNLSQQLEATQLVDEEMPPNQLAKESNMADKDGNTSGSDSEPTSSYRRFLGGDRGPPPELEATQPSTQVHDSSADIFRDEEEIPTSNVRSAPNPSGGGGRSLLSMVSRENQYRYRRENFMDQQAVTPAQPSYRSGQTSNGGYQETQPSNDPSFPPYASGNLQRTNPSSNASSSGHAPTRTRQRPGSPMPLDNMDFVPDSEPPAEQSPRKMVVSPAKPRRQSSPPPRAKGRMLVENSDVEMAPPKQKGKAKAVARQEEGEEEEDVPLAVAQKAKDQSKKQAAKGKASTNAPPSKEAIGKAKPVAPLPTNKSKTASTKASKPVGQVGPSKSGRSWGSNEVPSSLPEQDHPQEERNLRSNKAPPKPAPTKPKALPKPTSTRGRRGSASAPAATSKTRVKRESEPSEDSDEGDGDDTEPADEEYEEDEKPLKKRKRVQKNTAATERATRGTVKRAKKSGTTPALRGNKRLRSAGLSTAPRTNLAKPTRVFALWKQDCHYYPGTVHAMSTDGHYVVRFDDATDGHVTIDQLRLGNLRIGDDVLVANRFRASRVTGVDRLAEGFVEVMVDDDELELELSSIRIASKTIHYDWQDRILTDEMINPAMKPVKPHLSPSPSKLSMISVGPVRGSRTKVLSGTGLIVTLTAANSKWEKEKEKVMTAVKNSGGTVVDDLNTIFKMEGRHTHGNNAWLIKKKDAQWIGDEEIQRLFLIADEPNQKPKYLIALALGIPCLETTWLYESVDDSNEKPWLSHLLPQGYSPQLGARPSQQVDYDWGNSVHHLTHIMKNSIPCKLFDGKHILCVGPDMVPKPKKRNGVEEKSQEAMNALPRIILAMGAETVENVTEPTFASKELAEYDYLVIRDPAHYSTEFSACTTVHWAWVKESLIASRCLPLPEWPSAEYSQEA